MEECVQKFDHLPRSAGIMCNATWDLILCWPPTPAGTTAYLACPPVNGVDTTKKAFKICSNHGLWQGKNADDYHKQEGWTNYTDCLTPELKMLQMQLESGSQMDSQMKLIISSGARVLEMVGLTTSFLALSISIAIFYHFRQLRNNRTRIHGNLFAAILVQITVRLILYIDQFVTRKGAIILPLGKSLDHYHAIGIDNTRGLCESFYALLEYARTAMFMWMLIEGVYLHSIVTSSTLHYSPKFSTFYLIGWGIPMIMTASWAFALTMSHYRTVRCWWGYSFTNYFWILEGPRLGVIAVYMYYQTFICRMHGSNSHFAFGICPAMFSKKTVAKTRINFLFLVNIVRVLVTKLRESNSSEAAKIRKACRAAVVLLPLLGITNSLGMVHSPLKGKVIVFALWIYCTQFLTSFQGFFVAFFYCFLNGEVRSALTKSKLSRRYSVPKRNCTEPNATSSPVASTIHIAMTNV